ncbi:MAG: hypothetical protein K2M06_01210 [Muribaculaceae bacterium]|nr:hypothetical protein [Muribaculaceae bacterium]
MHRLITSIAALLLVFAGMAARQPERGYRGFFDWSNSLRSDRIGFTGLDDSRTTLFYTGFDTSHGMQFNPWLYAGGGLEFLHCSKDDTNHFRPFAHVRTDLLFGKFSPFASLRLGYNLTNGGGVYFSPEIGYRFNWGRKTGINIGAGLTLQGYKIDVYDISMLPEGYLSYEYTHSERRCRAYFSFRVGIDF